MSIFQRTDEQKSADYILRGVLAIIMGTILSLFPLVSETQNIDRKFTRFQAPGSMKVKVEKKGRQVIYSESAPDSRDVGEADSTIRISVFDPSMNPVSTLKVSTPSRYKTIRATGFSMEYFKAEKPGVYTVKADSDNGSRRTLAVGRSIESLKSDIYVFSILTELFTLFIGGLLIIYGARLGNARSSVRMMETNEDMIKSPPM